ncbi:MAG: hypothetical protein HXS41_03200 [Theionarchaea archaeon]|nr:hypothetical protein [Theionarchaea archaeon]MBU6999853.1 hypothetical protein [Theionarchaea archaeon]MBU7020043.1 hypothetical protein [Theionarchaea archaeon]
MLGLQGSVLVNEDMSVYQYLEYTVLAAHTLPEDLSSYDVIVISTPTTLYEDDSLQAIKKYVESGGGLLLMAEENNKDGTTLVINQIAQEFSITFNVDRIFDQQYYLQHTSWITLTAFPEHPIFEGIRTVVYTSGCSLVSDGGVLLQTTDSAYAQKYDGIATYEKGETPGCMVIKEVGDGRVVACGDKELFDTYSPLGDNTLFALNVVDWLAGSEPRIRERLLYKQEAAELIPKAKLAVEAAKEKGLQEVFPRSVEMAESLIVEAETLYNAYDYFGSHQKAMQARDFILDGEGQAEALVQEKTDQAHICLEAIEKAAHQYLPSQLEAAQYYFQEIESQATYNQRIEKADEALQRCEEIRSELRGAAENEIAAAEEKIQSYRGLFGRTLHHSARVHLENATDSYEKGEFGDAILMAKQSQDFSDQAAEAQKKDYILLVGIVLVAILGLYILLRK